MVQLIHCVPDSSNYSSSSSKIIMNEYIIKRLFADNCKQLQYSLQQIRQRQTENTNRKK